MDAQTRQRPIADEGAEGADDQVSDETEAATPHDQTRQPTGDDPDDQW
jgi:hypothetical protein